MQRAVGAGNCAVRPVVGYEGAVGNSLFCPLQLCVHGDGRGSKADDGMLRIHAHD